MASRDLSDLQPSFRDRVDRLLDQARQQGLDLLVYCTYRSPEEQARIYRQSRSTAEIESKADELEDEYGRADLAATLMDAGPQYGPHVTNAAPGQSVHQYGLAIDSVPMRGGKPVWGASDSADSALWEQYGQIAIDVGLEWAGNWTSFPEYPHVQSRAADWRSLIRRG